MQMRSYLCTVLYASNKIPSACCGQLDYLYSNDNKRNKNEIF